MKNLYNLHYCLTLNISESFKVIYLMLVSFPIASLMDVRPSRLSMSSNSRLISYYRWSMIREGRINLHQGSTSFDFVVSVFSTEDSTDSDDWNGASRSFVHIRNHGCRHVSEGSPAQPSTFFFKRTY